MAYAFHQDLLKNPESQRIELEDAFLSQIIMDIGFDSMQVKSMATMKEDVTDPEKVRYYKLSQEPIMNEFAA